MTENKKGSLSGSLCVIYARFSSAGQREESIEGQVRECKAYAKRLGMKVGEVYADRALSGTSDARPACQTSRTLKARVFTFLSGRALMVAKVPPSRLSLS